MTDKSIQRGSYRVPVFSALAEAARPVRPVSGSPFRLMLILLASLFIILISGSRLRAATPPGTIINNSASVTFMDGASGPFTAVSNVASVTTATVRTNSTLELLQYAAGSPGAEMVSVATTSFSTSGTSAGPFAPLGAPVHVVPGAGPVPIDLANPVPLAPATQYHVGEPVFVRVSDGDQNVNPAAIDTVLVTLSNPTTGDIEVLRVTETGLNTGVFTGYIQTGPAPAGSGNGVLNVVYQSNITASYTDIVDAADARALAALVDPRGMVFSSRTGLPVDGAVVTIVNTVTGLPATVYGDDGMSMFPASVTSGGTVVDSGGATYTFTPGVYRFPYITAGRYRLTVTPPQNYRAPSAGQDAALQALPGAPFALATPGSRGEEFIVNPGPVIHIDIPLDPVGGSLWLIKTAGKQTAAVGDFVPYRLSVENTSTLGFAPGVSVLDRLPAGFRYRKGSAQLNRQAMPDPVISTDGRTLTFAVGGLDTGKSADIVYVAEVGAGSRLGTAKNIAAASSTSGVSSNMASASIEVIEDLFRSTSTIVGRVLTDGCGDPARSDETGLAGVRIFLEDGTFAVTDKNGMFHFAAVKPGTHVVQLDSVTLPEKYEVLLCDENTRFSGNGFSQFVDVQGGSLWRADFHLAPPPNLKGEMSLELRSDITSTLVFKPRAKDSWVDVMVDYEVSVHVGNVPVRNMRLTVMLPDETAYIRGSSLLNTAPLADPETAGTALTFRLGDAPADWDRTLRFKARLHVPGEHGNLATRAGLTADTPREKSIRTPVVENTLLRHHSEINRVIPDIVLRPRFRPLDASLSKADRNQLNRLINKLRLTEPVHITVIGHSDAQPIRGKGKKKYADNYALSYARAESVARELAKGLKLAADQITILGLGPDEPIDNNKTAKGRARNRRVELKVETASTIVQLEVSNEVPASGVKAVPTMGMRPDQEWLIEGRTARKASEKKQDPKAMPDFNSQWLEQAGEGLDMVWPPEGHAPGVPLMRAVVKHSAGRQVKLFLNGSEVEAVYFDGTTTRADNKMALSTWRGLILTEGDNRIEAIEQDASGNETGRTVRAIHYAGAPVSMEMTEAESRLIADGRNPIVVTVKLLDKDGRPARTGMLGEFGVDPPYMPLQRATDLQKSPLVSASTEQARYQVAENGIVRLELQPTSQTGEAVIRIGLAAGIRELRAWIKPEHRDWILVGLAEGTAGYNRVTGNLETLATSGHEDDYYQDGRLAFYAKGMIKGEWLLTAAYDSVRETGVRKSMYKIVDPNKYYLLYGDATEQNHDAASARHIYVKLERNQFYALFGDFGTGLTVTELSRYSRDLTGFKSEFKGEHFEYNLFAADTDQAHVRDEIRGDGTSGLYHLSRKNIVLNSDRVTIESRDRFRSELITPSRQLARNLDYTIDYESGTIFFKSPVQSRDENFNPVFIVAEYETFDSRNAAYTYGGRAAVKMLDKRVQVGVTRVHEGTIGAEGDLSGVDASVQLTPSTKARAELATTKTDTPDAAGARTAYLAEVQHHSKVVDGKVYLREQESGFGLGQQNVSESGTRKIGGDVAWRASQPVSVSAEAFRQENLTTGADRVMAEARGTYALPPYELYTGLRHAEDSLVGGSTYRSEQLFAGAKYRFTDALTGRVQHDQTLNRSEASVDFPTRATLGLDYRVTRDSTVFADQEFTRGSTDTATSRVGIRTSPWSGAQLSSSMEQQTTEQGVRLFSTTGLKQGWQITKQWSVDAGLDRSATVRRTGGYQFNPNVPPASGSSEDFNAVFLGAAYKQEKWSWTARAESRRAESEDKLGIFMGANGEVKSGLGLAAGLQSFRTSALAGVKRSTLDLRLAAAYRPMETRFMFLDRLDYLRSEQGGAFSYDNWRLVNNFAANYKIERSQLSFQYACKYVGETIEQHDYHGYTDLTGIEYRYDVTKKWDIGIRGSRLHSWALHQADYGTNASIGFTAAKNLWISVGYNFSGFTDRDFSKAEFTAAGPFVKLRLKFDQVTARDAVKWISGQ